MTKSNQIIRLNINLRKISEYIDGAHEKKIKESLQKAGLLSDEFLYTIFNRKEIPTALL